MDPYYGICPTCGAYMGRGDGNQCRACRTERFAGEGTPSGDPAPSLPRVTHHKRLDPTQSAWVVTTQAGRSRSFAADEEDGAKAWAASFGQGYVITLPAVEVAP